MLFILMKLYVLYFNEFKWPVQWQKVMVITTGGQKQLKVPSNVKLISLIFCQREITMYVVN